MFYDYVLEVVYACAVELHMVVFSLVNLANDVA